MRLELEKEYYSGQMKKDRYDILVGSVNERENEDFKTLAGILVGVGFLLILISFGARRKRKGGAKKTEKKPATK